MNDFSNLAQYYDRFVGADYEKIADFIDHEVRNVNPDASLLCDVGCGSGTLTYLLLKKGYDPIGVDGSIDMLSEAQYKRCEHHNGDKVLFLCQQLPDEFELFGTVDVIVSTLDTINYITDPDALDRLFYWFHNYLNPGGILIFDINTLYKYKYILDQHCECLEEDRVFINWRSQFDGVFCSHLLTFFEKEKNSLYSRSDEEQVQRYYSEDDIVHLLNKYGFQLLKSTDNYSSESPKDNTQRITYVAIKKG